MLDNSYLDLLKYSLEKVNTKSSHCLDMAREIISLSEFKLIFWMLIVPHCHHLHFRTFSKYSYFYTEALYMCSIIAAVSLCQGHNISGKDLRVHCSLNINTETGRLSARRPNLQVILIRLIRIL